MTTGNLISQIERWNREAEPVRDVEVSIEIFPPKTPALESQLWEAIQRLAPLEPRFISVTSGAGGGARNQSGAIIDTIQKTTQLTAAAHLTCIGASREEIDTAAQAYWDAGIRHIVALRGDPPADSDGYNPHPDGYAYASDLIAGLKRVADFEVSAAAYPESHPEAVNPAADLDNLKRKVDAGACRAITQFFFDPEVYLRFVDQARGAGIDVPIVPGILPINNFERAAQFAANCGTAVPAWLTELFSGLDDDPKLRRLVAVATAVEQCRYLQAHGIDQFHFYTLNRADLTTAICRMLRAPAFGDATANPGKSETLGRAPLKAEA